MTITPAEKVWASTAERAARAFAVSFVGVYVMSGLSVHSFSNASLLEKAADAGLATLGSLILSAIGLTRGNKATPSLLPARLDPATIPGPSITQYFDAITPPAPLISPENQAVIRAWIQEVIREGVATQLPGSNTDAANVPEQTPFAVGVHAHPTRKLGVRPVDESRPVLKLAHFLTGSLPAFPVAEVPPALTWPMDHNDQAGDCVVAGVDHALQAIEAAFGATPANWDDATLLGYYQTQNPGFKAWSDGGNNAVDGGMNIAEFLTYLVKVGVILGFAKIDTSNEQELKAAIWLGGAIVSGETLHEAQNDQKVWDYVPGSPVWGGHCTTYVGFTGGATDEFPCVTWGEVIPQTVKFIKKQVTEAYIVITQFHVSNPAFHTGLDLTAFAAAFQQMTGRPFPVAVPPAPAPVPVPPKPSPTPGPVPTPQPADAFLMALAAIPGLPLWATEQAKKRGMVKADGSGDPEAYAAWYLGKVSHLGS